MPWACTGRFAREPRVCPGRGRSAFQDCELGLVTVPAGVTELDMWTFSGASLLNATLEGESTWSYTDREPSGSTAG